MSLSRPLGLYGGVLTRRPVRPSLLSPSFTIQTEAASKTTAASCITLRHRIDRRRFSAASLVNDGVQTVTQLITDLHVATGTPWFVTIPLVALTLNLLVRTPSTVYTSLLQRRRGRLSTLLQAWFVRHQLDVHARHALTADQKKKAIAQRSRSTTKRIYRDFGVQNWKLFSQVLIFPVWIMTLEAIRRLAGTNRSLIYFLTGSGKPEGPDDTSAGHSTLEGSPDNAASVGDISPVSSSIPELAPGYDPTLAVEGCLWFPDLTVPDPLHVLPMLLSVTMVLNLLPPTAKERKRLFGLSTGDSSSSTSTFGLRLRRVLLVPAALMGWLTLSFPAALHLYWVTSSISTLAMAQTTQYFIPSTPRVIRPCQGLDSVVIKARDQRSEADRRSQRSTKTDL